MTIRVRDADGVIQDVPTLADLVEALGVTRFFRTTAASPIIRPADTTPYAVQDRIAPDGSPASLSVSLADVAGQPFTIEAISLSTSDTGAATARAKVEMLLYSAEPVPGVADNLTYSQSRANLIGSYVGLFSSGTGYFSDGAVADLLPTSGANRYIIQPGDDLTTIWCDIKTLSAFTPLASSQFLPTFEGFYGRV